MTANAPASLVNLIAGGEKLSFFLGLSNTSPFTVVTQPNLRKAEDLKGKRLGTARFGGSSHISALIALEHLGLDLKRDKIILIQTGVDPERMAALEAKAIDSAMLQTVATKVMTSKGFSVASHRPSIPLSAVVTTHPSARKPIVSVDASRGSSSTTSTFTRVVPSSSSRLYLGDTPPPQPRESGEPLPIILRLFAEAVSPM